MTTNALPPDDITPATETAATGTPSRTQRRAAEMRERLIAIAEALLIEGGVAAVTADEVARRADVSLQTVYNRVGRKPELLLAIAERAMEENRRYIDAAYEGEGSVEERGMRIFLAYSRFAFERPHQFRILAHPPGEPEALARISAMAREQNAKLTAIIRDGIASGDANPALDPEAAANALWAMMDGLLQLALREDGLRPANVSPAALLQNAMLMVESGLRRR